MINFSYQISPQSIKDDAELELILDPEDIICDDLNTLETKSKCKHFNMQILCMFMCFFSVFMCFVYNLSMSCKNLMSLLTLTSEKFVSLEPKLVFLNHLNFIYRKTFQ